MVITNLQLFTNTILHGVVRHEFALVKDVMPDEFRVMTETDGCVHWRRGFRFNACEYLDNDTTREGSLKSGEHGSRNAALERYLDGDIRDRASLERVVFLDQGKN